MIFNTEDENGLAFEREKAEFSSQIDKSLLESVLTPVTIDGNEAPALTHLVSAGISRDNALKILTRVIYAFESEMSILGSTRVNIERTEP